MAAAAAGCAPGISGPATRVPVTLDEQDVRNAAALLRMEDARALDTLLVARLLQDGNPEIRGRAAMAAGRIRDRAATPLLLRALDDPDPAVRARAAFGLGVLGDTSRVIIEALSATVATAAARGGAEPAREAAAALGLMAHPAGRPALLGVMGRTDVPSAVRQEAVLALVRLPRDPERPVAAELSGLAADPDPQIRWRVAYALVRGGGTESVAPLLGLTRDADEQVRITAFRGLRAPLADSAGIRQQALEAALTGADDPHPHVRVNALWLLPAFQEPARTQPVLLRRLQDPHGNVAVEAAQALAAAGDAAAAAALAAVASDSRRPDGVRAAAFAAWQRLDGIGASRAAVHWADSARWLPRRYAASGLGGLPRQEAASVLERLARDPHPVVAVTAVRALGPLSDSLPHLRRIFMEQLASTHVMVRAAATAGLGRNATAADLDPLLLAYERALRDPTREAAIAAVAALGRLSREGGVPAGRAFFARFGAAGPPADPAVHRAIAENLGEPPAEWGEPRLLPVPREDAFYVDVVRRLVAPALRGETPPQVAIATPHGDIILELAAEDAPLTVHNFLALLERGYYRDTRWHRVVPNFVLQDGDPRGDGSGGPGYAIRDEINTLRYLRGTLGMALSGPDTGGGQFFITHSAQPHLDGGYTIFGRVVDGMDAADRVVQDDPILGFRRLR
jgi:cyclophilin family peptidyl-prolyl cis-trans isomerase/HEAT repeat protein